MSSLFTYLNDEPTTLILMVSIWGLIVGSFLNVVIHRLPMMMEREWREQCHELLGLPSEASCAPLNLMVPRSRCPGCGHPISVLENIPILSYLWQRGRCTACQQSISMRYPLVELTSGILAGITAWHFGLGWPLLGALIFTWALIAVSVIDFNRQWLPDAIVLPLLWLGILCNFFGLYTSLQESVLGAMAGYLILWSIYWIFKLLVGKEGMGYGDFKLLAMLGAWTGWLFLPLIILMSSLVGTFVGISLILGRGHDRNTPIPFGPYLAAAGWVSLLWGYPLTQFYFKWVP